MNACTCVRPKPLYREWSRGLGPHVCCLSYCGSCMLHTPLWARRFDGNPPARLSSKQRCPFPPAPGRTCAAPNPRLCAQSGGHSNEPQARMSAERSASDSLMAGSDGPADPPQAAAGYSASQAYVLPTHPDPDLSHGAGSCLLLPPFGSSSLAPAQHRGGYVPSATQLHGQDNGLGSIPNPGSCGPEQAGPGPGPGNSSSAWQQQQLQQRAPEAAPALVPRGPASIAESLFRAAGMSPSGMMGTGPWKQRLLETQLIQGMLPLAQGTLQPQLPQRPGMAPAAAAEPFGLGGLRATADNGSAEGGSGCGTAGVTLMGHLQGLGMRRGQGGGQGDEGMGVVVAPHALADPSQDQVQAFEQLLQCQQQQQLCSGHAEQQHLQQHLQQGLQQGLLRNAGRAGALRPHPQLGMLEADLFVPSVDRLSLLGFQQQQQVQVQQQQVQGAGYPQQQQQQYQQVQQYERRRRQPQPPNQQLQHQHQPGQQAMAVPSLNAWEYSIAPDAPPALNGRNSGGCGGGGHGCDEAGTGALGAAACWAPEGMCLLDTFLPDKVGSRLRYSGTSALRWCRVCAPHPFSWSCAVPAAPPPPPPRLLLRSAHTGRAAHVEPPHAAAAVRRRRQLWVARAVATRAASAAVRRQRGHRPALEL